MFGVVLWAAAISSVIGASYTSVSFLKKLSPTIVFVAVQQPPVTLLIFAGALNGLILPIGFGVLWAAARRRDLLGGYRLPGLRLTGRALRAVDVTDALGGARTVQTGKRNGRAG